MGKNLRILMMTMKVIMNDFKLKSDVFVAVNIAVYDYHIAWQIETMIFLFGLLMLRIKYDLN